MLNIATDPAPTKINVLIHLKGYRIENMLIEKNNTSLANCSLYATNLASFLNILGHIHTKGFDTVPPFLNVFTINS